MDHRRRADLFPLFHSTASTGSLNYGGFADPNVDRALEDLRSGAGDRNKTLHDIVTTIRDDEPYTFLFSPLIVAIVKKGALNVAPTPLGWEPRSFGWSAN